MSAMKRLLETIEGLRTQFRLRYGYDCRLNSNQIAGIIRKKGDHVWEMRKLCPPPERKPCHSTSTANQDSPSPSRLPYKDDTNGNGHE